MASQSWRGALSSGGVLCVELRSLIARRVMRGARSGDRRRDDERGEDEPHRCHRVASTALSCCLSALPGVHDQRRKLRYEQRCVATNAARLRAAMPPLSRRQQGKAAAARCLLAGPSVLQDR